MELAYLRSDENRIIPLEAYIGQYCEPVTLRQAGRLRIWRRDNETQVRSGCDTISSWPTAACLGLSCGLELAIILGAVLMRILLSAVDVSSRAAEITGPIDDR